MDGRTDGWMDGMFKHLPHHKCALLQVSFLFGIQVTISPTSARRKRFAPTTWLPDYLSWLGSQITSWRQTWGCDYIPTFGVLIPCKTSCYTMVVPSCTMVIPRSDPIGESDLPSVTQQDRCTSRMLLVPEAMGNPWTKHLTEEIRYCLAKTVLDTQRLWHLCWVCLKRYTSTMIYLQMTILRGKMVII